MSGGKIVAVLAGALALLLGLALIVGSLSLFWVNTWRDDQGFFTRDAEQFAQDSYAIASRDIDIAEDIPDFILDNIVTLRLEATSEAAADIFVGIGRAGAVSAYLSGVDHHVVEEFDFSPFRVEYSPQDGTAAPAPPTTEPVWEAAATGPGTQVLEWDLEPGVWSVVLMNADGSRGVDAAVAFGAKVTFLGPLAAILLVVALVLLPAAGVLLYVGLRREEETPELGEEVAQEETGPAAGPSATTVDDDGS